MESEGFNKSRFTNTGHTGDADTNAVAAVGQYLLEDVLGLFAMGIQPGLHQGDGFGQGSSVAALEIV